jgi:tol-pal system protein YbgF
MSQRRCSFPGSAGRASSGARLAKVGGHFAALAAAVVLAAQPAHAALFDDNEARRQIAAERSRIDGLSTQVGSQSQQLESINTRLGKIDEALSRNQNQAVLDLFREIENMKSELAKLRGQMEVMNNGLEQAHKRQQDFYVDLDTRLRRLETASAPTPSMGAVPAPGAPGSGDAMAGAKPGASAPPAGAATASAETRAYEAAQNLRRIGNYQGSVIAFQNFLKQYPKSPLAPSAQYWIGDSYFNMRDYRLAIASQRLLLVTYPDSNKVPDALLNIASAQVEMGETAAARKTMDELVAKHPTSEAAEKARRRMANVR